MESYELTVTSPHCFDYNQNIMKWTKEEVEFLRIHYPMRGKRWCAEKLNRKESSIRSMTSFYKIYQDRNSDFFKDWQSRARQSKIGKKRPDQANIILKLHKEGKLKHKEGYGRKVSERFKKYYAKHGHPKGMLGKKHSEENKLKFSIMSKMRMDNLTEDQRTDRIMKIMRTRVKNGTYSPERFKTTWKQGWREIGGYRKYYRSRWEANYARYLEWLKINNKILDWAHEPTTFWFEKVKRGAVSYLPDFKITNLDNSEEYHEVKGWMDNRSATKIKRMAKYHPKVKLIIINKKEYKQIENIFLRIIKGWE
jgi:hypothetical protein